MEVKGCWYGAVAVVEGRWFQPGSGSSADAELERGWGWGALDPNGHGTARPGMIPRLFYLIQLIKRQHVWHLGDARAAGAP